LNHAIIIEDLDRLIASWIPGAERMLAYTSQEVAGRLNRSVHTVESFRRRINAKLGLRTAPELVRADSQWALEIEKRW
jgi:hypothetical protein